MNFGENFKSHLGDDQVEVDSWTMFSYSLQIIQITGESIMSSSTTARNNAYSELPLYA